MLSFQSSFVNGFGPVPHGERGQAVLEASGDIFLFNIVAPRWKGRLAEMGHVRAQRSLLLRRKPAALFGIEFPGSLWEHEEGACSQTLLGILLVLQQIAAPSVS